MIGLDTDAVLRYVVEDDEQQTIQAAALIEGAADRGEVLFVSKIVLCEVVWVLRSAYEVSKAEVVALMKDLVRSRQLLIEDKECVQRGLLAFEKGGGDFADYLIREQSRAAGCERVATFDRALLEEDGFVSP